MSAKPPDGGYKAGQYAHGWGADITVVFCANDNTAIGAIRAFKESRSADPEDISIIGVDDIENRPVSHAHADKYPYPPLTSLGNVPPVSS